MTPEFRPIPFTRAWVSRDGRVWTVRGGALRLMKPQVVNGYMSVILATTVGRKFMTVHRLVALAWLDPPGAGQTVVRHLDDDASNNDASNLAWGSGKDNAADRDRNGRTAVGEAHGRSVLTETSVRAIRARASDRVPQRVIAAEFGVSRSNVQAIVSGATWAHVA